MTNPGPFIFTLTSIDMQDKYPKSRCWGWMETLEDAEEYLYKDFGDIHEGGTNKYAVIEKCEPGVCPMKYKNEDRWYRFVRLHGLDHGFTVILLDGKPEDVDCGIGISMG